MPNNKITKIPLSTEQLEYIRKQMKIIQSSSSFIEYGKAQNKLNSQLRESLYPLQQTLKNLEVNKQHYSNAVKVLQSATKNINIKPDHYISPRTLTNEKLSNLEVKIDSHNDELLDGIIKLVEIALSNQETQSDFNDKQISFSEQQSKIAEKNVELTEKSLDIAEKSKNISLESIKWIKWSIFITLGISFTSIVSSVLIAIFLK